MVELRSYALKDVAHYIKQNIEKEWGSNQTNSLKNIILKEVLGYNSAKVLTNSDQILEEKYINRIQRIVKRLKKKEPIQYILGYSEFYGMRLLVNSSVLIPRPETEELVSIIIENTKPQSQIIDLCTGSGCIALALAKATQSRVWGVDVSDDALKVAQENASKLNLDVTFSKMDILKDSWGFEQKFDVIVSNPPYVKWSERVEMNDNVLKFEPPLALFVDDDDALVFYRKIMQIATNALAVEGTLYFEINQALGSDLLALASSFQFEAQLRRDLYGKDRFLIVRKNGK